jgi:hypothetical protein
MQPAIPMRRAPYREPVAAPSESAPAKAAQTGQRDRWGFLELFIFAQIALPALLYLPGSQALRVPIRIAPFALSLAGFAFLLSRRHRRLQAHPATALLILILSYLTLMIASPQTNTLMAGAAQVMLYFSVMAPVFWAPALVKSKRQLQRIMMILLVCNGINALVGVLQVKYPDQFMPREFSSIVQGQAGGIPRYIGPNGEEIIRPTGLSDNPGAVCAPASVAALLGLLFALRPIGFWARVGAAALAFIGVAAIFLSHVRTSILILAGMYIVYCLLLVTQGNRRQALILIGSAASIFVGALLFAAMLGGESVLERFATLFESDPSTVYYQSARGYQLQYDTKAYLSEYPLGAGLGRWGMMRLYFGDENNAASPPLWAELQWPAWALDGGIVLLLLYMFALLRNSWHEFVLCRKLQKTSIASYAAMIFASNAGVFALVFGFTPFTNQVGLQYWFLAGVLHGAAQLSRPQLT